MNIEEITTLCSEHQEPDSACRLCRISQDPGMMEKIMEQVAESVDAQKDQLMMAAITHQIGEEWDLDQIKDRGEIKVFPDKTELFSFDGVDLISFRPPEFVLEGNSIKTLFDYKLLY
jgi:hypothetical protein